MMYELLMYEYDWYWQSQADFFSSGPGYGQTVWDRQGFRILKSYGNMSTQKISTQN